MKQHLMVSADRHDEAIIERFVGEGRKKLVPVIEKTAKDYNEQSVRPLLEEYSEKQRKELDSTKLTMEQLIASQPNMESVVSTVEVFRGRHSGKLASVEEAVTIINRKLREIEEKMSQMLLQVADASSSSSAGMVHDEMGIMGRRSDTGVLQPRMERLERVVDQNEGILSSLNAAVADLDLRVNVCEIVSYDGTLVWKVTQWTRRRNEAKNRKAVSVYSQPFYTSVRGYKCCARLYPNGDGQGQDTHASLFFVIMQNDYDAIMTWPFSHKVTFTLINQEPGGHHIRETFRPDTRSSSFQRPVSAMNVASGCPKFASLRQVDDPRKGFLKDDCIFIQVSVDTSTIRNVVS